MRIARSTPALVLGSTVTALGTVRSLGRRGVVTHVATPVGELVRKSRWFRPVPGDPSLRAIDFLAGFLEDCRLETAVILAASDSWVEQLAALPPELRERFPASVASANALATFTDKGKFAQLLSEIGVPSPLTIELDGRLPLDLPEAFFESAFLKPSNSQEYFARFGIKGRRVSSRTDAERQAREMAEAGFSMLLQEYVAGPSSDHYFIDGFVDRHGVLKALLARRRLRMYPPDFGNSSYMVSVPPREAAGAIETIERLFQHLRYRGIFSAEFKRDARDGLFKILEVNARPWWYVEFTVRCGVDVVWMAYQDALGHDIPPTFDYKIGQSLVYTYYDFFACRDLWRRGELSLGHWAGSWLKSQRPVFCWDDPWPAVVGTTRFAKRHVRKLFRHRT